MTFTTDSRRNELAAEHEMAYFRADVCLSSPQYYSLELSLCNPDASLRIISTLLPTAQFGLISFQTGDAHASKL